MQPYEKFKTLGAESLSDEELLAIFIRTGTSKKDSVEIAGEILDTFPKRSLLGLCHIPWKTLTEIPGIGEVKAVKLKCLAELARRISQTKARKGLKFDRPETVAEYYMESLRHEEKERVVLILLDKKLHLISDTVLSIGTVSESLISPRELFLIALREKAVQIILLHNHPSGDASPSGDDLKITERIRLSGQLMGIPLIDHIIIGDNQFTSLRQAGYMKDERFYKNSK